MCEHDIFNGIINNDAIEIEEIDPSKVLVFDYLGDNRINDVNDLAIGMCVNVIEENMSTTFVVDDIKEYTFVPGKIISCGFFADVYRFDKVKKAFEFIATGDPETMLENSQISEGDVIFLAVHGSKSPAYSEDSTFNDIFGFYMVIETMESYIDSYIDICYEEVTDSSEEDDDYDDVERIEHSFVPLKPFFMYLKDNNKYLKDAREIFNQVENDEIEIK